MGIQFFEEYESSNGELLFAKEYLLEHPKENGKEFAVVEIMLVKSNKGYLVKTDTFVCWLWKRSSTAMLLIQALEIYVRDQYGYAIVAVLDKNSKDNFKLGVNSEIPTMWFGTGKKYSVNQDIPSFDVEKVNPFLIPLAPLTPITPVQTVDSPTNGTSQKKHGKTS